MAFFGTGIALVAVSALAMGVYGRRAGAAACALLGAIAAVTGSMIDGRAALGELALGLLVGLPILIGVGVHQLYASQRTRSAAPPHGDRASS
ncbi:hypothetical protein GCM10009793_09920 [Brachybacterium phenoliresistens]